VDKGLRPVDYTDLRSREYVSILGLVDKGLRLSEKKSKNELFNNNPKIEK